MVIFHSYVAVYNQLEMSYPNAFLGWGLSHHPIIQLLSINPPRRGSRKQGWPPVSRVDARVTGDLSIRNDSHRASFETFH